jgi:hypothetical protein
MTSAEATVVVLDPALAQLEPQRFDRLLDAFAAGYQGTFHGDEAEPPALWRARILGEPPPQPVLRIALAVDAQDALIGGAAAELYRDSGCVLATYLYVLDRPGQRKRGRARGLLRVAFDACARIAPVRALLAEVEWPAQLARHGASAAEIATAEARLGFFGRIGGMALGFDYVQPALAPAQAPATWLRLLALPIPPIERQDEEVLRAAVRSFLPEFHAALGAQAGGGVDAGLLAEQRAAVDRATRLLQPLDPMASS